jgi:hypothetical protein
LSTTVSGMRICTKCGQKRALAEFSIRTNGRPSSWCKPCDNALSRDWRIRNPEKALQNSRRNSLKRNYGLSLDEYDVLLEAQGGLCAICGVPDEESKLSVDHCHETNRVRGLLCVTCNFALGHMKDDPDRLIAAAEYLLGGER